ncbi:uncharacterized protein N7496_001871 [Penicillium cataractarum]|uniref:Uncharacterized protein n=1 Tax=Penicillium cataractarum TaxID=2100454 RepID=A0A9W9VWU6_9EURO|nr:uncharacterized protein N7496_001871 [Penicillium cataractarum]KAJ5390803.1 hypothetical protein N7496_001871 [Penicillium cataractarum]
MRIRNSLLEHHSREIAIWEDRLRRAERSHDAAVNRSRSPRLSSGVHRDRDTPFPPPRQDSDVSPLHAQSSSVPLPAESKTASPAPRIPNPIIHDSVTKNPSPAPADSSITEEEIKAVRMEIADVRALVVKLDDQCKALQSKLDARGKADKADQLCVEVANTTQDDQPKMGK